MKISSKLPIKLAIRRALRKKKDTTAYRWAAAMEEQKRLIKKWGKKAWKTSYNQKLLEPIWRRLPGSFENPK